MIKPDIIVCWPRNCDYPLWRQFIRDNRERFNLVIIVFTETNYGEDYRTFVKDAMHQDYVLCIDNIDVRDGDWRDVAIHQALIHSYNAEWIWFTEQDFIVKDRFWESVEQAVNYGDEVIAAYDFERMHPCSIFVKREVLNRTHKRFGIVPNVSDHFSLFQKELEQSDAKIYRIPMHTYQHLNGLSHNMTLIFRGELPNWEVGAFNEWVKQSLAVSVPLDTRWETLFRKYLSQTGQIDL